LLFQSLDDKSECVGVYVNGRLHFNEEIPTELTHTWKYSGSIVDPRIEYAWLYCNGRTLAQICPHHLEEELNRLQKRFRAYVRSFTLGKINLREHCFYDLVSHDFLLEFCEIKNQITKHILEHYEKPANYKHLAAVHKLIYKMGHRDLMVNNKDCRHLFVSNADRRRAQKLIAGPKYIEYNLFGTSTGRLATCGGFPILTMRKDFRRLLKPHNDWFLSLDYNGAEARTALALSGQAQPAEDIHAYNMKTIFKKQANFSRADAKRAFFAWLYNPESTAIQSNLYNKTGLIKKWYENGHVSTPFKRRLSVDHRRAFNYLIQSTTADLVLEQTLAIDKFLEDKKSFVSHLVHDEIVIDLADSERNLTPQIRDMFADNRLASFQVNLQAGLNYFDLEDLKI